MWRVMEKEFNSGLPVDMDQLFFTPSCSYIFAWKLLVQINAEVWGVLTSCVLCRSFYVGDAAGRPNDHSDADSKFAQVHKKP